MPSTTNLELFNSCTVNKEVMISADRQTGSKTVCYESKLCGKAYSFKKILALLAFLELSDYIHVNAETALPAQDKRLYFCVKSHKFLSLQFYLFLAFIKNSDIKFFFYA